MPVSSAFLHAWVLPRPIDETLWAAIRRDAIAVLRAASSRLEAGRSADDAGVLRGPQGMGLPQIGAERIAFNGSAFRGEAGDAFVLERVPSEGVMLHAGERASGRAVRRCDTAGRPYDLAVCALLLVLERHLGDTMRLGSSGGLRDGWRDAAGVVRDAVGARGQLVQSERGLIRWADDVAPERAADTRIRSAAS